MAETTKTNTYKWLNPEPGKLVMDGYPFSIAYRLDGKFVVTSNGTKMPPVETLAMAKKDAVDRCDELREIGVL